MTETTPDKDDIQAQVARLAGEMSEASASPAPATSSSPTSTTSTGTFADAADAPAQAPTPWKGKYPNPWVEDYSGHPIAQAINGFADDHGPASAMKLGDSWAATVDYYMHTTGEVHPAILAFGTSACFAVVAAKARAKPKEKVVKDPTKATTDSYGGVPDVPDYP